MTRRTVGQDKPHIRFARGHWWVFLRCQQGAYRIGHGMTLRTAQLMYQFSPSAYQCRPPLPRG